jgi:predicted nucleic acid-binding protein
MYLDTNVLLYLKQRASPLHGWVMEQLVAKANSDIAINAIVFAELAVHQERVETLQTWLAALQIDLLASTPDALFRAAQVFRLYRQNGGPRHTLLPDFFIGADAAVAGRALMTNDPALYRTYFPDLELVTP